MSAESKPVTFIQRLRYRWFRFGSWWFLVLRSLGALFGVAGVILSLVGDDPDEYGPWWIQVVLIAFCGLFVAVGLKGVKIKSVAVLEAEDAVLERRISQLLAWLSGTSSKK